MNINWFEFPDALIIAGVALLLFGIYHVGQRWRKSYPMLGFKEWINAVKDIIVILWAASMTLQFVVLTAPVIGWIDKFEKAATSAPEYWVFHFLVPLAYVFTVPGLLAIAAIRLLLWKPMKYNKEEQAFLNADRVKWKAKLGRFGFLIKVKGT